MAAPLSDDQRIIHFLNRTSFGPTREEVQRIARLGVARYLDEQLEPDKISDALLEEKLAGLKTIRLSSQELIELYPQPRVANQQGAMAQMQSPRQVVLELQLARLLRAVYSRRQLYEVMVDFWSNHFNIFAAKGADRWLTTSYDRDTIRPHALGRFRDLLLATAKSPAMLFYLDNWMSVSPSASIAARFPNGRRHGINENYARELMELHTLGVDGGYTQKDVQEVARCFTGWTIQRPRSEAEFLFNPRLHDNGAKTVLGTAIPAGGGMGDGLKVIDLLARHPSTARFIATKLARRFVADDPPPPLVSSAAEAFRRSDGDIRAVLRSLLESREFFTAEFYRGKVKKPLEFVASALRITESDTRITPALLRYLGRMGEPLFLAQAPTGYADTASTWVSPDMLLTRINFATELAANKLPGSRVRNAVTDDAQALARFIAPEGLSPAAQAAVAQARGNDTVALLLAAPEFQRR
jgi:uncharacterized protein (DUF1800 family)